MCIKANYHTNSLCMFVVVSLQEATKGSCRGSNEMHNVKAHASHLVLPNHRLISLIANDISHTQEIPMIIPAIP